MKRRIIILLSFILVGLLAWRFISGPTHSTKDIDAIFESWNGADRPGGAVAVVEKGQITYSKAFGLASLEYTVPNQTETIFNLASVSKQFTAYGICLLAQEGKLSLEDDIRKHLPEVPDFGKKITIRHMLNHTSGMRSLHALLGMAGWRGDDRRSNEDIRRFMQRQEDLNFEPNSEHLYCNTGYMFAADIIEKISGQSYEAWMKKHVFDPLGMANSFCRRNINEVVPNVATSYYQEDNQFSKAVEYWAYIGSGNMHSTIGDLTKWIQHFRDPGAARQEVIDMLQVNGILNDGETIDYALGLSVRKLRGLNTVSHGGSIGGYRSYMIYFPDQDVAFIVLANFSAANPARKAYELAELFFKDIMEPVEEREESTGSEPRAPEMEPIYELSDEEEQALIGRYYSRELDTYYDFVKKDGNLQLYHARHGYTDIKLTGRDLFQLDWGKIDIVRNPNQDIQGLLFSNGRARNVRFIKE